MSRGPRRNFLKGILASTAVALAAPLEKAQALIGSAVRKSRKKVTRIYAWGFNTSSILTIASPAVVSSPTMIASIPWAKIDSDEYVTFGLKTDNTLWAWGKDNGSYGVFGNGTAGNTYSSPIQVAGAWKDFYVSKAAVLGIKTDNTLWGWGTDNYCVLPTLMNNAIPVYTVASSFAWTQIDSNNSAGQMSNTVAVGADNFPYCFGSNESGQLGLNNSTATPSLTLIASSATLSLSVGTDHTAAVLGTGALWVSGSNTNGPFGNLLTTGSSDTFAQSSTANIDNKSCTAGNQFTYMIKTTNTLWFTGQSPDGVSASNTSSFVQVGAATNWLTVKARNMHVLGLQANGTLWSWGTNTEGRLGLGDTTARANPVQVGVATNWSDISAGYEHSMALTSTGDVYVWGSNGSGHLGLGTTVNVSTPVKMGTSKWQKISAGNNLSAAIRTDGTLWVWGDLSGFGTMTTTSTPTIIGAATNWVDVVASYRVVIAKNSLGQVYSVGDNYYGNAGALYVTLTPIQFGTGTNWKKLAFKDTQVVAIKTDGSLWNWGWLVNTMVSSPGVAGYRATLRVSTPVQQGTATDWTDCVAHYGTMMALKSPGTLWAWGNDVLKNGLPSGADVSTPVQVGAATDWASISLGINCAYGLRGTNCWVWGAPARKEMGLGGTQTPSSSPTQLAGVWKKVQAGNEYALGIKGTQLYVWGYNSSSQLGDTTTATRSSPILLGSSGDWTALYPGPNFTYGRRDI